MANDHSLQQVFDHAKAGNSVYLTVVSHDANKHPDYLADLADLVTYANGKAILSGDGSELIATLPLWINNWDSQDSIPNDDDKFPPSGDFVDVSVKDNGAVTLSNAFFLGPGLKKLPLPFNYDNGILAHNASGRRISISFTLA